MRPFLEDVLRRYGAELGDDQGALTATLPAEGPGAELAQRLGSAELALVFEAAELRPGTELVAPGSHVLRVLEELLAARAPRSFVVKPAEHRLTQKPIREQLGLPAGRKLKVEARQAAEGYDLYVVYRVRYHCLERTDTLETVRVELRPGRPPRARRAEPPAGLTSWELRPRKRLPAAERERALAAAGQLVAEHAQAQGELLREDVRRRFTKDMSRLDAYYAGQIAEYRRSRRVELALIRIEELQEEHALRVAELTAASKVRAEVEPIQLLTVELPLQTARVVLLHKDGSPQRAYRVLFDRSSGALALEPAELEVLLAKPSAQEAGGETSPGGQGQPPAPAP